MKRTWVIAMLIGVVTLAVYWPVTRFQFVNLDDPAFISENPHVQAGLTAEGFKWAWGSVVTGDWHPITMLSLMLDCQLFGVNPWWPHLVNILLHAANAMLLFGLLKRMTGAMWHSAVVAGFFALHPLHVESVAWVCERKDVLSTFFWLLTMWAYVGYADGSKAQGARRGVLYGLSLLLCALGMMSKPMVVTLPLTLLLLDYWPLGRKPAWGLIWEKIPYLVMSAGLSVATLWAQSHGGGLVKLGQMPVGVRLGNAAVEYVHYIGMMIWPRHLAGFYPMRTTPWPWWVAGLAAALLVVVSVLAVMQRVRRPWLAMGWVWYVGTLLPVIGLLQAGSQAMADRFTYAPLIGLFVMLAWGVWEMAQGWRLGRLAAAAAACGLALCAGLTVHQEFYWKDSETFNKRLIEVMPHNFMGHNGLGVYWLVEGDRTDEALSNCQAAVEEMPIFPEAHNNLGIALERKGRIEEAISQYQEAIRLKPDFAEAHNDLGNMLRKKMQMDEAIGEYEEAIRLKPDFVEARNNLGTATAAKGHFEEAIRQFEECLRLKPEYVDACLNLARAQMAIGQTNQAIEAFRKCLRMNPKRVEASYDLAAVLGARGELDEAMGVLREVIRLKPNDAKAYSDMGAALAQKGKTDEAIQQFQEAIRLKPDFYGAHFNLGMAYNKKGQTNEAIRELHETLRLAPDFVAAQKVLREMGEGN